MRRRFLTPALCFFALLLALTLLSGRWFPGGSQYSRNVEENSFILEMDRLNCTLSEPFALHKGDIVDVEIARLSGELALSIGQENLTPIYEGNNPDLNRFHVTVPEDGVYFLSASGKRAKGQIAFRIKRVDAHGETLVECGT